MKKWMLLTVPVAVVGLALAFWGGAVFAQEPANPQSPVVRSGNWTEMADYCRSAGGMSGMGGMMDRTTAATSVNWTEMQDYCQNAGGMMGTGNMSGGMMSHAGMMGDGGMMGGGMMGR